MAGTAARPKHHLPPPPPLPSQTLRTPRPGRGQSPEIRRQYAGAMTSTPRCPTPPSGQLNLWMVPYAGRSPSIVVGCALCRAESSRKGAGAPATPQEWAAWPRLSAVRDHAALALQGPGNVLGWKPVCNENETIGLPPVGTRPAEHPGKGNQSSFEYGKGIRRPQHGGPPGGVIAPDPPTAAPMVSAPPEGACLWRNSVHN